MNLKLKSFALKTSAVLVAALLVVNCGPNNQNAQFDIGGDDPTAQTEGSDGSSTKVYGFRVMFNSDASTSAVIGFSSDYSQPNSCTPFYHPGCDDDPPIRYLDAAKIYYDTTDYGIDSKKYANVVKPTKVVFHKSMANYFLELKNLKPSTAYYFLVADGKGKFSKRYWFKTVSDSSSTRLSIVSGGDTRTNRKPRQEGMKIVSKLRPDVVMFQGDHTTLNSSGEWRKWLSDWQLTISSDGRMTPGIFTRGNHEASNAELENLFDTPKGVYYGTSLGGELLRVYTLNSESAVTGNQTKWLTSDLTANSNVKWKFAQYHSPIRPHTSGKKDDTTLYQAWANVFYNGGMNVVAEADSHTVKRTFPLRPDANGDEGFSRDDESGTVFIGEGCWGAPLRANDNTKSWTRDSGRFNQFFWIFVDKSKTEIRTVVIENPDIVESVSDSDRYSIPKGLNIWNPSSGAVQTIQARK